MAEVLQLQVVQILVGMVTLRPACLRDIQEAHGVSAVISLLHAQTTDHRLAPAAQQVRVYSCIYLIGFYDLNPSKHFVSL